MKVILFKNLVGKFRVKSLIEFAPWFALASAVLFG